LSFADQQKLSPSSSLTSIVVVFKNELENLRVLIPKLLEQDHPNFEIILCDDHSTDDSYSYAESLDHDLIRLSKATVDLPGKKSALKEAIQLASGENILLTDADCYPSSRLWVSSMTSQLVDHKIVLGYSPHLKAPGWLNRFVRFETFMTALQYFTYALSGIPYMGVGRNLLYKRSLFLGSDAIDKSSHLVSGDDDIFINAESNMDNTNINLNPKSFVYTYPPDSFSTFLRQKRRHVSTATAYQWKHKFLLAGSALSHIMIYVLLITNLLYGSVVTAISVFVVIMLIKWIIAHRAMKNLQCSDLSTYFPILDLLMVLYYIFMAPATFFKTKNW